MGAAITGRENVRPSSSSDVSTGVFGAMVSMFRHQRRHACQLSFAPLPGAFEPGPGIVLPQPRPLHSGQTLQRGAMRARARCKTSL